MARVWTFDAAWEDALWRAVAEELGAEVLARRILTAAVTDRTLRYTSERQRLVVPPPAKLRARDLAARALFFSVADAAKVAVPVAELEGRGLLPAARPLRVLDVGAGAGAMTLGLAAALAPRRLEVLAVDQDGAALAVLERAARYAPAPPAVRTLVARIAPILPLAIDPPFDLILAGSVLNELPTVDRLPLVARLLGLLDPGGALIVIEPALRETARALHELRSALLREELGHVFAPCTRRDASCPALAEPGDWCHEDRPLLLPPRMAELARATGLRREGLKFAYLTVRRRADPLCEPAPGWRALRVVSGPLDAKGTIERIVCGEAGRHRIRVLRRDRGGPSGVALSGARRGDVLLVRDDPERTLERIEPAAAPADRAPRPEPGCRPGPRGS